MLRITVTGNLRMFTSCPGVEYNLLIGQHHLYLCFVTHSVDILFLLLSTSIIKTAYHWVSKVVVMTSESWSECWYTYPVSSSTKFLQLCVPNGNLFCVHSEQWVMTIVCNHSNDPRTSVFPITALLSLRTCDCLVSLLSRTKKATKAKVHLNLEDFHKFLNTVSHCVLLTNHCP